MMPASPATGRLPLLGCLLALTAALALSACGSDGAATADSTSPAHTAQGKRVVPRGEPCPIQVNRFIDSLDKLPRQLVVGLSYEQYAAKVMALKKGYDKLPIDRLTIECLTAAGTPIETALNKYIEATNVWGGCLADASCSTSTIGPVLQRKWRIASSFLSEAH